MERTEKQYKVYSWDDTHLGWWYEGDMHAVSEAEAINRFIYIGMPVLRTERKRFEFKAVLSTEEITETEEERARHQKAYDEMEAKRRYLTKEQIEVYEKEHKALEIIKNKGVLVDELRRSNNVDDYNMTATYYSINYCKVGLLSKDEFDLLKEVMK